MSSVAAIADYLAELEKARQQAWREYDRNGRTRYHEGVATGLERAALLTRKHMSPGDALAQTKGALALKGETRTAPAVPDSPQGYADPTKHTRGAA